MSRLKAYQGKRNFDTSGEPTGETALAAAGQRYVLHKHDASQLHYDLRLEQDGVLRSWAIPKGPSLKVGEKRLAVEVDDHPLEYGDFEGVIPKEDYGGGTVMVWDHGEWRRTDKGGNGEINFVLYGEKLQGAWTLVRMGGGSGRSNNRKTGDNDWLLIKRRDREAGGRDAETLAALGQQSVLSGRGMDAIAAEEDPDRSAGAQDPSSGQPGPAGLDGTRRQKLPQTVQPQLATLVEAAPQGDDWLHEFKFDGYRLLARLQNGQVQLLTRNNKDWSDRFPELAAAVKRLPADRALLDGEAVAFNSNWISDFERVQKALSDERTGNVVYQAFDLLNWDGHDLRPVRQSQRKQALEDLLRRAGFGENNYGTIRYTDHLQGRGAEFFQQACRLGLEGIVCKRDDSAYAAGRSKRWLKVKCIHSDEFVVGGFTDPGGSRTGFGSLVLGAYDDNGNLIYSGRVGTGFNDRQLEELHAMFRKAERKTSPFANAVPDQQAIHWVTPKVVVEVEYTQRTRDGRLRHPAFHGLREDKNADEVRLPAQQSSTQSTRKTSERKSAGSRGSATVAGVRLTHPQRVLFPEMGLTKLELARHFETIGDWIVPALADRPVSLLRCPEGWNETCFFQKHPGDAIPDHVPVVTIAEKNDKRDYVTVRSIADLVGLVQAGTLELHVWGSRTDDLERPDSLVFDLDPGPEVPWEDVVHAARGFGERLETLGLASFVRVTGGKGLHLVVPLTRKAEWEDAKAFAHAVSQQHARTDRKRLTTNMSRDKRRGRIFIDYLRNGRGATAIASYSPRARDGAPSAVPIRWDELGPALRPDGYRPASLRHRLTALNEDPWAGFAAAKRPITQKSLRAVQADSS